MTHARRPPLATLRLPPGPLRRTGRAAAPPPGGGVQDRSPPEVPPALPEPLRPLLNRQRGVVNPFRHGRYLHVSDLIQTCIRKVALSEHTQRPLFGEPLSDAQQLTFAQGQAVHTVIQQRVREVAGEQLYGDWVCGCGGAVWRGLYTQRPADTCARCQQALTRYQEVVITHEALCLVGSPDLVLQWAGRYTVTEIKSMNGRQWETLTEPVPNHVIQVLLYWWLWREAGYPVHDQVSILYVNKQFSYQSPYKEFILTPTAQLARLELYWQAAREWAAFRAQGRLPPRVTCADPRCTTAKACPLAVVCFNLR